MEITRQGLARGDVEVRRGGHVKQREFRCVGSGGGGGRRGGAPS